jgi:hypothetical protein
MNGTHVQKVLRIILQNKPLIRGIHGLFYENNPQLEGDVDYFKKSTRNPKGMSIIFRNQPVVTGFKGSLVLKYDKIQGQCDKE